MKRYCFVEDNTYFLTYKIKNSEYLLDNDETKDILNELINEKFGDLDIFAYSILSNHLHMLVSIEDKREFSKNFSQ